MSAAAARQHLEWLRFAEPTGPFLSLPPLLRAFPQGVEKLPRERAEDLAEQLVKWRQAVEGATPDLAVHRQWCLFVLRALLGWSGGNLLEAGSGATLPNALAPLGRETLSPDLVLMNPAGHPFGPGPRVLISFQPPGQPLDRPVPGRPWRASPTDRLVELLRGTGVRLGLVTNGAEWRLAQLAAGDMPGVARWDVDLWFDERGTLDAFVTMLEARRFFGVAASDTPEALFEESAQHQHEITVQLGDQVRRAVEVLVQALDRADRDAGGALLTAIAPAQVYDAALSVMMRLVFLFAAEERGLIGAGSPLYQEYFGVSTLLDRLAADADRHGEEVLETRQDAWARLLAAFRAVHGGASHEDLSLPAYGGSLFNPDHYEFLEGRSKGTHWREMLARPLPVSNRTVLHLLRALQELEVRTPGAGGEKRRLSFRELDIEDVGHVYEGLLDHTALRATPPDAPVLGLKGSVEPEIPLPRLEAEEHRGHARLIEFLREETRRGASAIERALSEPVLHDEARARRACGNDTRLYDRVRPWLGLVRGDTLDEPVIVREGSVYVTAGAHRRTSGTYYTPRSLTEPIVRYSLEPLVYNGPTEGMPETAWTLRTARELLNLRVCDFAMGSGAFLVQACRYLATRLIESWEAVERSGPSGVRITPEGERSSGDPAERLIPMDPEERMVEAMRLVADRCLFGVDANPMAVEMAKLSLWLVTLQKDRPFNFLDHALRCGDSLVGIIHPEQLAGLDLSLGKVTQVETVAEHLRPALATAIAKRRELENFPVLDVTDAERKAALLAEADSALQEVRAVADLLVACTFGGQTRGADAEALLGAARDRVAAAFDVRLSADDHRARLEAIADDARHMLDDGKPAGRDARRPFHWPLEFPEVFEGGGFDAMVANPPFLGGQKITGTLGTDYRDYLVNTVAGGTRGSADLSAYFMLRVSQLLRDHGTLGMIATNTIAQGDTREVGLEQLLSRGFVSPRAVSSQKWPGEANLEVAILWLRRGSWAGSYILDGSEQPGITPSLTAPGLVEGKPYRLAANAGKSFQGSIVLGMGFVLTPDEAKSLIAEDARNGDVVLPYLNGEDLNSRWDQSPSRWVINFQDWPLDRESAPAGYRGPVAADYPDCLGIVTEKVRPEREELARGDATARDRARRWWQFGRPTVNLYATIAGMERVIATCLVTTHLMPAWVVRAQVFAHKLAIFALDTPGGLGLLTSTIHEIWARHYSSTLAAVLNYSPSDCFETFPFPAAETSDLRTISDRYDSLRARLLAERREGLTALYNDFHSPDACMRDIAILRDLHAQLDHAVAAAYGWTDLELGHGFHTTRRRVRFTLSNRAQRELLGRLLALNHERYKVEVSRGLHDGTTSKAKKIAAKSRLPRAVTRSSHKTFFD
jgi:hypothetical protein